MQFLLTKEELSNTQPKFGWQPTHTTTLDTAKLLAYIEWRMGEYSGDGTERCPCCDGQRHHGGHAPDCLLYKLLRDCWKEHPGCLDQSWLTSDKK